MNTSVLYLYAFIASTLELLAIRSAQVDLEQLSCAEQLRISKPLLGSDQLGHVRVNLNEKRLMLMLMSMSKIY